MTEAVEARSWARIALMTCPAILLLGWASGWFSGSGYGNPWFDALRKPSFMPPGWAFPVAWTILYLLMGIALAMILALPPSGERRTALTLFFVQLALNFAWSPLFFAAHAISLAKWEIFLMTAVAAVAGGRFMRLRKAAGILLIPYLAWLVLASVLNSTVEALNPDAGARLLGVG